MFPDSENRRWARREASHSFPAFAISVIQNPFPHWLKALEFRRNFFERKTPVERNAGKLARRILQQVVSFAEESMNAHSLKSVSLSLAAASLALLPMGCKKQPPITLSCNATPPAVFAGEQVTATATAGSVSTKKNNNLIYSWSGT